MNQLRKTVFSLPSLKISQRYFRFALSVILSVGWISESNGQDPQFTQFYAQPLYLNPAFTGSSDGGRLIANFRNQWPSLNANFRTYAISYDQYIPKIRAGVGLIVKRDQQTGANNPAANPFLSSGNFSDVFNGFQTTDLSLMSSYLIPIKYDMSIQVGLAGVYTIRDAGWNNFIFANQIATDGSLNGQPPPNVPTNTRRSFFDLNLGALLYTPNLWFGFSISHLLGPSQSFITQDELIPIRYSLHAGYKINFDVPLRKIERERGYLEKSITPVINYFHQGSFDQLSLGAYGTYGPVIAGLWYRGLPLKLVENEASLINHDAVAAMAGFHINNLTFTYSYDYTISGLNPFSGGSHEIAIKYIIAISNNTKPSDQDYRRILCPSPSNFGSSRKKPVPDLDLDKTPQVAPNKRKVRTQ